MGTIIEVGANHGDDTERLLDGGRNIVYAFEPDPELIAKMQNRFRGMRCRLIQKAVDLEEGPRAFNISSEADRGVSSLYNFIPNIESQWQGPEFKYVKSYQVEAIRLDTFIRNQAIKSIDYLWIDAQGNDFRVLKSLGDEIDLVKEGKCEAAYNVSLYAGPDNGYRAIVAWLKTQGFEVAVVPDAAFKECDVHFIRHECATRLPRPS